MTDEEIEFALEQYSLAGGRNVQNMDWAGTLDYIHRLKAENESLRQSDDSKEKCIIEQHAEIHRLRDELKQVRKDTAKEILQEVYKLCGNLAADNSPDSIDFMDFARAELLTDLCQKYGVEVDDE